MITGSQCCAARALVEITRAKLARRSAVDEPVIEQFEREIQDPDAETITALKAALEMLGAVFIDENGGGIGTRLKLPHPKPSGSLAWKEKAASWQATGFPESRPDAVAGWS